MPGTHYAGRHPGAADQSRTLRRSDTVVRTAPATAFVLRGEAKRPRQWLRCGPGSWWVAVALDRDPVQTVAGARP
jgi:hypothetical protein